MPIRAPHTGIRTTLLLAMLSCFTQAALSEPQVIVTEDFEFYSGQPEVQTVWLPDGYPNPQLDLVFGNPGHSVKLPSIPGDGTTNRLYWDLGATYTGSDAEPLMFSFDFYLDPSGISTSWHSTWHLVDMRGYGGGGYKKGGLRDLVAIGVSAWTGMDEYYQGRVWVDGRGWDGGLGYLDLNTHASVLRMQGWHRLEAKVTTNQIEFRVDGVLARAMPVHLNGFNTVVIGAGVPADHAAHVDNIRMEIVNTPSCVTWNRRFPSNSPSPRYASAMVYEGLTQQSILFGGLEGGSGQFLDDTWNWNGHTWAQQASSGPPGRLGHALAYDSLRGKAVLFGGGRRVGGVWENLGDTWEWHEGAWSLRSTSGPAARQGPAMVYDESRDRTVLFGGFPGNGGDDTWEWDGNTWSNQLLTGPSPRNTHAMAYDSARKRVVLFGGWTGSAYLGDTWEYDGISWMLRATTGPARRREHVLTFDKDLRRVVLFGGWLSDGTKAGDTWQWDGNTWTPLVTALTCPGRGSPVMCYDFSRKSCVLFGGSTDSGIANDTWELSDNTRTILLTVSPPYEGSVIGNSRYCEGRTATLEAVPKANHRFAGWAENGSIVNSSRVYTFTVTNDRQLAACFARTIPGDFDDSGNVDNTDVERFTECAGGPGLPAATLPGCDKADLDMDGDVDQSDFGILQCCFSGEEAGDPDCSK